MLLLLEDTQNSQLFVCFTLFSIPFFFPVHFWTLKTFCILANFSPSVEIIGLPFSVISNCHCQQPFSKKSDKGDGERTHSSLQKIIAKFVYADIERTPSRFSPQWEIVVVVVVQFLSRVWLFAAPWTAARQASLSFTISGSLLKLMSIESVMPYSHLILCCSLLLPSVFPSIRVFSNESSLPIRWPRYWSFNFSINPSDEYSGLISFRTDWLDLFAHIHLYLYDTII